MVLYKIKDIKKTLMNKDIDQIFEIAGHGTILISELADPQSNQSQRLMFGWYIGDDLMTKESQILLKEHFWVSAFQYNNWV